MRPPSPAPTADPPPPGLPVHPAAASVSVRDVLTAPARPARVLGDFGRVAYLDVAGDLLALSGAGAVRLPFALVLPGPLPPLALNGEVLVGDGAVRTPTAAVEARRWWRPPTPRPGPVDTGALERLEFPRTGAEVIERSTWLEAALVERDADALAAAVDGLVGLGPGLTPAGDDVLAGALLAGHGTEVASSLSAALPPDLRTRTTALAAALLASAARGEGTPEGAALVEAVRGHGDPDSALAALLTLGHSSGSDTALGILVGARAVAARTHARPDDQRPTQEDM